MASNQLPAGMRNNNPGNIKFSPTIDWQGQLGPSVNTDQGDPQVVFDSPQSGMRALAMNVLHKYNNGYTTINQLIAGPGGWTPGYGPGAAGVAAASGLPGDQPLDMNDPGTLGRVMRGIVTQEQGPASQQYSDQLIASGIGAAGVKQYDSAGNPIAPQPASAPAPAAASVAPAPATGAPPAQINSVLDEALGPTAQSSPASSAAPNVNSVLDEALGPAGAPPTTSAAPAQPPGQPIATGPGTFAGKPVTPGASGNNAMSVHKSAPGAPAPGYTPSSVPWLDPVAAAADSMIDSVPVIGHPLMGAVNQMDAGLNNLLGFPSETASQRGTEIAANNAAHPVESAAGSVAGTVLPFVAAGTEGMAAKALGTASDYGLGAVGNIGARVLASGTSSGLIAGSDTLARGGDWQQAGHNALVGGAVGAAAPVVAKALGGPTALKTIAGGAAVGGAVGAGGTLATGGSLQQAGQNALTGATVGAAIPAGVRILGSVGAKLVANGVPEPVAQLADAAVNKYGIQLSPAQISSNPFLKMADSVVNRLPLTGGTGSEVAQKAAFTRAVSNEMGEDATALTPSVMGAAKTRIGGVFQSVANNTPQIAEDNQLSSDLLGVMSNAQNSVGESQMKPIENTFNNIVGTFQNGGNAITGKQYLAMTAKGSPLDAAIHSSDPAIGNAASQFRDALDGALQRSADPSDLAALQQARYQWKVMRTVEDLAEKAPTGEISPPLLMGAVRKSFPNMAYDGGGNMGELANIGQQFLKAPPNSGTPERMLVNRLLGVEGAAGGAGLVGLAMNPAAIPGALAGGAAYAAGAPMLGAAMRSKTLANTLISNGLGRPAPFNAAANTLTRAAVPLTGGSGGQPVMVFRNGRWIPQIRVGAPNALVQ